MSPKKELLHFEVLSQGQKNLLPKLDFLKKDGFYLAGGTALALQINHRTSIDFDFYTKKHFKVDKLHQKFEEQFQVVEKVHIAEDTLVLKINQIGISFFTYRYDLIRPLLDINSISVASIEDIAAMKILAISQRGRRRDFIDIYFLIQKFGLDQIIKFTQEKYPMFNIYIGLQGLTYFKDADDDFEEKRFKLFKKVKWNDIKKHLINKVNKFRITHLKYEK